MSLIDTHLHLWDRNRFAYPWLAHVPLLDRDFLPRDIDHETADADRVLFVQADCLPEQGLQEAEWVSALDGSWPQRLAGIIAFAPLDQPGATAEYLSRLARIPGVVGVRRLLEGAPDELLRSSRLTQCLALVAEAGLTFDACVSADQLPALVALKSRLPELRLVLDHLGKPPVRLGQNSPQARHWAEHLRQLARLPGTFVKLSGLAPEANPLKPLFPQVAPYVDTALEAFGAERTMLGSDWPVSARIPTTTAYGDWFTAVLHHLALEDDAAQAVRHTSAERGYRIADSTTAPATPSASATTDFPATRPTRPTDKECVR